MLTLAPNMGFPEFTHGSSCYLRNPPLPPLTSRAGLARLQAPPHPGTAARAIPSGAGGKEMVWVDFIGSAVLAPLSPPYSHKAPTPSPSPWAAEPAQWLRRAIPLVVFPPGRAGPGQQPRLPRSDASRRVRRGRHISHGPQTLPGRGGCAGAE